MSTKVYGHPTICIFPFGCLVVCTAVFIMNQVFLILHIAFLHSFRINRLVSNQTLVTSLLCAQETVTRKFSVIINLDWRHVPIFISFDLSSAQRSV